MPKSIDTIVKDQFRYLITDFQFRLDKCEKIEGGFDFLFISNCCCVHIVYEFREAYLFIAIHRLQSGKFVDNPRPIQHESLLTGYSLDDILLQRSPDAIIKPAYSYGADSEYYDKERGLTLYVSQFANNLREYAADVLAGDFKIFTTLEPIVKMRAKIG